MTHQDLALRATDLTLAYGQRSVLEHVSIGIRWGEFWCCLGPNGTGKSTFLRAILGDVRPRQGELWLHPTLRQRRQIGVVPQRCDLNTALPTTVREFVLLGTVGTRIPRREYPARLAWALGSVGLQEQERQSYWTLSGGQRQRALVARALVRQPRLLLLDEPTNHLDLPTAEALLHLLVALHRRERLTLILVTHDIALAARYATHVLLLRDGQAMAGPVEAVLTPAHLERAYGVSVDVARHASGMVTVQVASPGDMT